MPRDPFKALTLQEQKFVFHFLREGAHEEKLYLVERKAKIPKGKGIEILRRKHVALEIERRKAGVELEQNRLIARDQNRNAEEEDRRQAVTLDKIEAALDKIIALNPEKYGSLVLSGIQTGLVYTGTIRSGRMERMQPPPADPGKQTGEAGSFYRSIFDSLRQTVEKEVAAGEAASNIFDAGAPAAPLIPGDSEDLPSREPRAALPAKAPAPPHARPEKSVEVQIT